jgi:deoxyhypusine synthase
MHKTAFGGRQLGEAFEVLCAMARDPECTIVLTLSGAMTVAKMGLVVSRMIEAELAHIVVSTGALIAHGLTEGLGLAHYKRPTHLSDEDLYGMGYNRVYDTLELECNFNEVEDLVNEVIARLPEDPPPSSERLCREMGRALIGRDLGPGILQSAHERDVPIYIPAFTDSEVGLDLALWAMKKLGLDCPDARLFGARVPYDPFADLTSYARRICAARRLGIVTIGGGVPRNWAQQVAPLCDAMVGKLQADIPQPRFTYGVRICPEPVYWGGLSGCTYSEGVSWGKFVSPKEGGRYAEVLADATMVWPLLVRAVLEELGRMPHPA